MPKLTSLLDPAAHAALSPALRELYVERNGKFVLDTDAREDQQQALEVERQARKALEDRLKAYGDSTPEEVRALAEAKAKAEREKDFAAGNFEKILAEERAKHQKDLELKDQSAAQLRASLESALIGEEATRAIVAEGGNPDLLLPIIRNLAKLEPVGERFAAVVVGEKGGPLLKAGAQKADDYMSISEYVKSVMKPDKRYAGAFASGVGSGTGGVPRPVGTPRPGPGISEQVARLAKAVSEGAKSVGP